MNTNSGRFQIYRRFVRIYKDLDKFTGIVLGETFRRRLRRLSVAFRYVLYPEYSSPLEPLISERSLSLSEQSPEHPPAWLVEEMRLIGNSIDPQIYPTADRLLRFRGTTFALTLRPGTVFQNILLDCDFDSYNYCFLLPWIMKGGSDKEALIILSHLHNTNHKILVILTESIASSWIDKVPIGVTIINIAQYLEELTNHEQREVLARLIIQLNIKKLHIMNSRLGFESVETYGVQLKHYCNIYLSIYCDDFDDNDIPSGYARTHLPLVYEHLTGIICDNSDFPKVLQRQYGYNSVKFYTICFPVPSHEPLARLNSSETPKILWASRLCRQKKIDQLFKIAEQMPDCIFDVYGYSYDVYSDVFVNKLKQLNNVVMKGEFNDLTDIRIESYQLFLYTSGWDGMPNILLEIAAIGLPIVSCVVGGISDLLDESTGFVVIDSSSHVNYVNTIRYALSNPLICQERALAAQDRIKNKYSNSQFVASLSSVPNYL